MTQHQYSIAPSDMAFHALTTSLYKDRLRAPVREILSNSIDSQRRTGNAQAIEIKLPTVLDAQFRIRDYGSGLSKKDMTRLYSSLFSSDKHLTRPNEVGGFGVGAKSPFAYTDAFTVESYHEGKHTVYSAFMDGNRAPQLLELFEQDTAEANGLAVSYPVAKEDVPALIHTVRQEVAICGHPVDCLGAGDPIVVLEKNPAFESIEGVWLGSDTSFLPKMQSARYESDVKTYVRMGNVVYPLSHDTSLPQDLHILMRVFNQAMGGQRDEYGHRSRKKSNASVKDWRVAIFEAPIGSVRPAMSREELVLNDPLTIDGLVKMHLAGLRGIYQRALHDNDPSECMRLFSEHQRWFSTKPPTLPKEWAQELAPMVTQLETIAEKIRQEDALWKPRALMVDSRLVEMLTHYSKGGRFAHKHVSGDPPGVHPHHLMKALRPFGTEYWHGDQPSIWSSKAAVALLPFDNTAGIEHLLRGFQAPKGGFVSSENQLALLQTISQIDIDEDSYFGGMVLLIPESKENEKQLLQLANECGKDIHVLDILSRSAHVIEPTALVPAAAPSSNASPLDPANPYSNSSFGVKNSEPFTAHYWDIEKDTLVATTLTAPPPYCVVSAYKDKNQYAGDRKYDEELLRNWQTRMGTACTFYTVPQDKMDTNDQRNGVSRLWQETAEALVESNRAPSSSLEWLIDSLDLPEKHPLHRPEKVQHLKNHQLWMQLKKHSMRSRERHFRSQMYTDFGWSEELPMGSNPTYDKQLIATYPLLNTLAYQSYERQISHPEHLDAIREYIALVDRTHGHDYSAFAATSTIAQPSAPSL